jgi:hypothetical protein
MQGLGIFLNCLVMTALLMVSRQGRLVISAQQKPDDSQSAALLTIWRSTYAIGTAAILVVLLVRILYLQESAVWLSDKRQRENLARNTAGFIKSQLPVAPAITHSPSTMSGPSMISDVSSLSGASIAVRINFDDDGNDEDDMYMLQEVPSRDPLDDLQSNVWILVLRNYGVRLFGVSSCWLLWDGALRVVVALFIVPCSIFSHFSVSFYGNKLFQSTFILSLTGEETTLLDFSLAATLNAAVALAGYLGAAWLVDRVGRRRLQQWGFLLTGVLFVGCGFLYQNLSSSALVAMYLGSSFFGQLGPNATTFLLPAEVFPFNYVSELDMFLLSGYASLMACAVTMWTIPETLGLDLFEIDRKWRMTLDGRKGEYQGDAIHPKYLSYYEQKKVCLQQRHDRPDDHFEAME